MSWTCGVKPSPAVGIFRGVDSKKSFLNGKINIIKVLSKMKGGGGFYVVDCGAKRKNLDIDFASLSGDIVDFTILVCM